MWTPVISCMSVFQAIMKWSFLPNQTKKNIFIFFCRARWVFFVPFPTRAWDGLLSRSLSSRYHTSSAAVKVKCLLTWPPRIIDCGVTRCACVRMHVTLWLHTAGSVGIVWKHLQFKGPGGSLALQCRLWKRRIVVRFEKMLKANATCFVESDIYGCLSALCFKSDQIGFVSSNIISSFSQ